MPQEQETNQGIEDIGENGKVEWSPVEGMLLKINMKCYLKCFIHSSHHLPP